VEYFPANIDQRFDYTLFGDISKDNGSYNIYTTLIKNNSNQVLKFPSMNIAENYVEDIVRAHGAEIVRFLRNIQLTITISSIEKAENNGDYDTALQRIDLYVFQNGNSTDIEDIKLRIEKKKDALQSGGSPRNNTASSGIDELLSQTRFMIDSALDKSVSAENRKKYYDEAVRLVRIIHESDVSLSVTLIQNIASVEQKIVKYENEYIENVLTGGVELSFTAPLLFEDVFTEDAFLEYYPDISGLTGSWIIPGDSESWQLYLKLNYWGFNNHAVQKSLYLDDARVYKLSLSFGAQILWRLTEVLYPFIFFDGGYIHFLEYAKDDSASALVNFGGILYGIGGGIRVRIAPHFMLDGNVGAEIVTGGAISFAISYSLGISYFFYGEYTVYR
jgi:hypothetical protein